MTHISIPRNHLLHFYAQNNKITLLLNLITLLLMCISQTKTYKSNVQINSVPFCNTVSLKDIQTNQMLEIQIALAQSAIQQLDLSVQLNSNILMNIAINSQIDFCYQSYNCSIPLAHVQKNNNKIKVLYKLQQNKRQQSLILCVYNKNELGTEIQVLKKGISYRYQSHPQKIKQKTKNQAINGQIYLLKPSSQSLKAYFSMIQGYPIILPYQCRQYNFQPCLSQLLVGIQKIYQQIRMNKYMALNKIVLSRKQQISIDYCTNCYWLIYMDCAIQECQVQFKYDTAIKHQYEQNNIVKLLNNSYIKQNRFHLSNKNVINKQLQIYRYHSNTDSQLIYYSNKSMGNLYITCNHLHKTYIYKIMASQNTVIIISKILNSSLYSAKPNKIINCEVRINAINIQNSLLYHSNLYYQNIEINRLYSTLVNTKYPAYFIYEFPMGVHQINVNVKACSSTPFTVQYYFLPNYQAIMSRNRSLDEKDGLDDIQNWVANRRIRVDKQMFSKDIVRMKNMYYSNYVVIQIHSDSTSYIQFSISKESPRQFQMPIKQLNLTDQHYQQLDTKHTKFHFNLQLMNNQNLTQIRKSIQVYQSHSPYILQLQPFCPYTKFVYPQFGTLTPILITNITINICNTTSSKQQLCIYGISNQEYIGIKVKTQHQIYLKVIDIKSKINIIHKYLWIFVVAGICFLLIFVAVIMLFITAPTQPISTAKPANIKEQSMIKQKTGKQQQSKKIQ